MDFNTFKKFHNAFMITYDRLKQSQPIDMYIDRNTHAQGFQDAEDLVESTFDEIEDIFEKYNDIMGD